MRPFAKLSKQRVLAILMCVSVVTSILGSRLAGKARMLTQWAVAPFGDAGMYVTTTVANRSGKAAHRTEDEYRRLEEKVKELQGQAALYKAELLARQEQRQGRELIYGQIPPDEFPCALIDARVIARDSLSYGDTGLLSVGSRHGVVPGARVTTRQLGTDCLKELGAGEKFHVVTTSSLVGRVVDSWPLGATLQLVTDRGFSIKGCIHRVVNPSNPRTIKIVESGKSRVTPLGDANNKPVPGFAEGDGEGLTMKGVSENDNIMPGDILATCKDMYVPVGIRIGEVSKVAKDSANPGFVIVHVSPYADLRTLYYVYVIVPLTPESKL